MTNEDILKDLSDSEVLFLTIVGEARGESIEGQVAVANVVMNRARKSRKPIKEVCLAPRQFSCWNQNDPNRQLLENLADMIMKGDYKYDHYKQIQWVTEGVITGKVKDNTRGVLNYMTTALFQSEQRPSWAKVPKSDPFEVGNHTFFTA